MLVPLVLVMAAGVVVIATEVKDGKRLLKNPPVLPTFFRENAGDFSPVFFFAYELFRLRICHQFIVIVLSADGSKKGNWILL